MKVMFFHDPEDIFAEAGLRNCTKFAGGWVEKDIFQNQFDDKSWCTRINILVFLHPLKEHTTNGWKNHATSMCLCIDRWKFHSYVFVRPWKNDFFKVLEPWCYGILRLIVCQLYLTKRQEPERRYIASTMF